MMNDPFAILRALVFFVAFILFLMANNVNPDQTPQYVASDLGLHCLLMSL